MIDKREMARFVREAVVAAEEFTDCLEVLVVALGRSHEEVEECLWSMVWGGYTSDEEWEACVDDLMRPPCRQEVAVDPMAKHCLDYMRWTYERRFYGEN